MDSESAIKHYSSDIKKIANFYYSLWSSQRWKAGLDDLVQAGRVAVWNVSQRDPEKLERKEYIRAAIKYEIIGQLRPKKNFERQIYVIGNDESQEPMIDLAPARDNEYTREIDAEDVLHKVAQTHSQEAANSMEGLFQGCRAPLLDIDLRSLEQEDSVKRVKLITGMDLSDPDMVIYARILTGDLYKFPPRFLKERGREKSGKYLRHVLGLLDITPEEFIAKPFPRKKVVKRYRLGGIWEHVYNRNYGDLILDAFPDLKPYRARLYGKWTGEERLTNAYDAITDLVQASGKNPEEITLEDFQDFGLHRMLRDIFGNIPRLALEFAFPKTFDLSSEFSRRVKSLREELKESTHK